MRKKLFAKLSGMMLLLITPSIMNAQNNMASTVWEDSYEINKQINSEGCLTASWGQYPETTFVPQCIGQDELITGSAVAADYSMVQVTNGKEYTFTSSSTSDYITIGNQEGTEVLGTGTESVQWVADFDGEVRFYTHADDQCTEETSTRSRLVRCGEFPSCNDQKVFSFNMQNGYHFGGNANQHLAIDIRVPGENFNFTGIKVNVLETATFFNFKLYENNEEGLPGNEILATSGTIVEEEFVGNNLGYDFNSYTVEFESQIQLDAGTTYWLEVETDAFAWESTNNSTLGDFSAYYNTNTSNQWLKNFGDELVYELICGEAAGNVDCEQVFDDGEPDVALGIMNGTVNDVEYRHRIANDIEIPANSLFSIEAIEFNLVAWTGNITEDTLFDIYIYNDDNGPGSIMMAYTGLTGEVTPNGFYGGVIPMSKLVLTLPIPETVVGGESGARYWIGVTSGLSTTNDFVQMAAYRHVNGHTEPLYLSEDLGETWSLFVHPINGGNREGMMSVKGSCESLGIEQVDAFDFSYYPNPVKDYLTILSEIEISQVAIYNTSGRQIKLQKTSTNKIDMSSLPSGIYLFKAQMKNGSIETFKIIKK